MNLRERDRLEEDKSNLKDMDRDNRKTQQNLGSFVYLTICSQSYTRWGPNLGQMSCNKA